MRLGERVRRERKSLKLTQAALARELGVTQPTVSDWEAGNPIDRKYLPRIAAWLKLPLHEAVRLAYTEDDEDEVTRLRKEVEELRAAVRAFEGQASLRRAPGSDEPPLSPSEEAQSGSQPGPSGATPGRPGRGVGGPSR